MKKCLLSLLCIQDQIVKEMSSHDEHASASTASLLSQQSDKSEMAAHRDTSAAKTQGKVAVAKVKDIVAGAEANSTAQKSEEEHHEVGSEIKSRAASLAHAAEHLKEATVMLQKKMQKVAGNASDGNLANATRVAGYNASAAGKAAKAVDANAAAAPDLLAYSKEQKHPGDTIHVLFTSNGTA